MKTYTNETTLMESTRGYLTLLSGSVASRIDKASRFNWLHDLALAHNADDYDFVHGDAMLMFGPNVTVVVPKMGCEADLIVEACVFFSHDVDEFVKDVRKAQLCMDRLTRAAQPGPRLG